MELHFLLLTSTSNRQSHTINTRNCYLLKITVSMKLHVSAHESHHQAYKYCKIKMKNASNIRLNHCTYMCLTLAHTRDLGV